MKSLKAGLASAKAAGFNAYKSATEAVLPARTTSTFEKDGKLTPEEFTVAGDFLVRTYPTWSWEAGEPSKVKLHLPDKQKQYLITRNVPCYQRAAAITAAGHVAETLLDGDDGEDQWVAADGPGSSGSAAARASGGNDDDDIPTLGEEDATAQKDDGDEDDGDDDDVPDIDDLAIEDDEADEAALPAAPRLAGGSAADNIRRTRTYDLMISYDKFHVVPRTWLVGYDEDRQPLTPEQIFQDISEAYARKTATVEQFPHTAVRALGIHPCKHAETMRRLADTCAAAGGNLLDPEHYMVLFLKFIASVIPTIEYDYTSSAGGW